MIDLSHIPETPGLRVFLPQGVDANSWQSWQKPRGFVMATIYAIGPGGGGGGGASYAGGSPGGGGGGGSGGVSRITIPLFMLPDTLHIRVTPGGSGGAAVTVTNTPGIAGHTTFSPSSTLVSIYPSITSQYNFLIANAGGAGGGGTSTVGGSAGSGALISSTTASPLSNLGSTLFIAGNSGTQGSALGENRSITQGTASQIYGGTGGGGTGTNDITGLANTPFSTSLGGGYSTNRIGNNGFSWNTIFPLKIYGGTGGSYGGTAALATSGGFGSGPGAGGGGGAAKFGTNPNTISGAGGDGGPGCVIIQCW